MIIFKRMFYDVNLFPEPIIISYTDVIYSVVNGKRQTIYRGSLKDCKKVIKLYKKHGISYDLAVTRIVHD